MLEVQKLLKLLIVHHTIAIVIDVSFLLLIRFYRNINITINQQFNVLLQPFMKTPSLTVPPSYIALSPFPLPGLKCIGMLLRFRNPCHVQGKKLLYPLLIAQQLLFRILLRIILLKDMQSCQQTILCAGHVCLWAIKEVVPNPLGLIPLSLYY